VTELVLSPGAPHAALRYREDRGTGSADEFDRIGEATRRLYPERYWPADPAAWLRGREVTIATYAYREWDETYTQRVLWIGGSAADRGMERGP